jgi:hypothetical protein
LVLLDVNEPFIEELQDYLEDYNNPRVFSNVEISLGLVCWNLNGYYPENKG